MIQAEQQKKGVCFRSVTSVGSVRSECYQPPPPRMHSMRTCPPTITTSPRRAVLCCVRQIPADAIAAALQRLEADSDSDDEGDGGFTEAGSVWGGDEVRLTHHSSWLCLVLTWSRQPEEPHITWHSLDASYAGLPYSSRQPAAPVSTSARVLVVPGKLSKREGGKVASPHLAMAQHHCAAILVHHLKSTPFMMWVRRAALPPPHLHTHRPLPQHGPLPTSHSSSLPLCLSSSLPTSFQFHIPPIHLTSAQPTHLSLPLQAL